MKNSNRNTKLALRKGQVAGLEGTKKGSEGAPGTLPGPFLNAIATAKGRPSAAPRQERYRTTTPSRTTRRARQQIRSLQNPAGFD
jgi:hypothetical protein